MYRWKDQVDMGGTRFDKLNFIAESTYQQFSDARANGHIVHDFDIKRFALRANLNARLENFATSPTWIKKFKDRYGIVSRKITKFVIRNQTQDEEKLLQECEKFVTFAKERITEYEPDQVFNIDQSGKCRSLYKISFLGFQKELHTGRTLAYSGQKSVEAKIQNKSAMTHSNTIQPMISMEGTMPDPMLVILQEQGYKKTGKLGPRVSQNLFKGWYFFAQRKFFLRKKYLKYFFLQIRVNNVCRIFLKFYSKLCC